MGSENHPARRHSLWAHNHTRNPEARPALLDWVDNVTCDGDMGFIRRDSGRPANRNTNVVGDYFIAGTAGKRRRWKKAGAIGMARRS